MSSPHLISLTVLVHVWYLVEWTLENWIASERGHDSDTCCCNKLPLPVRDEDGPAVVYRDVACSPGDELGVAGVLAGHLTVIITMIIILSLDHDRNVTDRPRAPGWCWWSVSTLAGSAILPSASKRRQTHSPPKLRPCPSSYNIFWGIIKYFLSVR